MSGVGRRTVLRSGLLAAGGAAVGSIGTGVALTAGRTAAPTVPTDRTPRTETVTFRARRQPGIVERPQPFASFVGLDLPRGATKQTCRRLLRVLTDDIERLMSAQGPLTDLEPELAEVPSRLSVTVAVGPGFYDAAGLTVVRPEWLAPLPRFGIDRLDPQWPQTDLLLQIRADSPVSVAHAQRRLVVGADQLATQRWVQRGFREPLTETRPGMHFRNHFGQVDGTVQPATDGTDDALIWIGAGDMLAPVGLHDGTSLVIRRIAMNLDTWDQADRMARENAMGRRLATGAPLTGTTLTDPPDLSATDELGLPVIDPVSHMRRAMPTRPDERILRAPYSYDDPPGTGRRSDSGLLFVSYQADPVRQFLPIQQRLADADLLNIWTTPVSSGVYAVLPGAGSDHLGAALLA